MRLSVAADSGHSRQRSSGRPGCEKRCRRNTRSGGRGPTARMRSADTADGRQEIVRRAPREATRSAGGGYASDAAPVLIPAALLPVHRLPSPTAFASPPGGARRSMPGQKRIGYGEGGPPRLPFHEVDRRKRWGFTGLTRSQPARVTREAPARRRRRSCASGTLEAIPAAAGSLDAGEARSVECP